ncbi:hypothetical protein Rhe02_13660 [Rhizocola hellebori]|uniref:Beta-lactamase-related domain-containing protein n=1 Tax=Rhizocola hellebori TaxID=1392758 RepID=A0A8J3Q3X6_9ACTN|nr:serine hydrolase domain-containing protein [Rhizocola hellebori]GIH03299.1 hypothetical protein Rhe02_13660 [Rhizocola hellebori]
MASRFLGVVALSMSLAIASACAVPRATAVAAETPQAEEIAKIVREAMKTYSLRGVIVKVTKGADVVTSQAFGESLDGVPATTEMRFRNGAVVFAYLGTLLMLFVEEGKAKLDDTIDRWQPELPEAKAVTLKMLANQTTGYPDFETDPKWGDAYVQNPFQSWGYEERLKYAFSRPQQFPPGTNWSYSHTNFMILGQILSQIGGQPLDVLLQEKVLGPMFLTHTTASQTGSIADPVLHAFDSERRQALGIPPSTPFYEESTFWNSDWGTPVGANQTTTIDDLAATAIAVGTGKLLTPESFHAMTDPNLLGFGHKQDNCAPSCFTQTEIYNYGLGVVRTGDWILQNPLLGGYAAIEGYLPSAQVGISVAVTFLPGAFDCQGNYPNAGDPVFRDIAAYMTPDSAPPQAPPFQKATC